MSQIQSGSNHHHTFNCTFCNQVIARPLILICFHPVCLDCLSTNNEEETINNQPYIKIKCKKCAMITLFSQDFSEKYSEKDVEDFLRNVVTHKQEVVNSRHSNDLMGSSLRQSEMSEGNRYIDVQQSSANKMGQQKDMFHTDKNELTQMKNEHMMMSQAKQQQSIQSQNHQQVDEQTIKKQGTLKLMTHEKNTNPLVLSQSGIQSQHQSTSKLQSNNVFNLPPENEHQLEQHFGQPLNAMNSSGETTKEIYKQIDNNTDINNFNTFNQNPMVNQSQERVGHQSQEPGSRSHSQEMMQELRKQKQQLEHQLLSQSKQLRLQQEQLNSHNTSIRDSELPPKQKRHISASKKGGASRRRSRSKSGHNHAQDQYGRNCNACTRVEENNYDLFHNDQEEKNSDLLQLGEDNLVQKLQMLSKHAGLCALHSKEPMLYCKDCKEMICLDCHFTRKEHEGHDVQPLKQCLGPIQQETQNIYDAIYYYESDINTQIQNAQLNHNLLAKKHQEGQVHLASLFKKIYLAVQQKEVELTQQMDQYYAVKLKSNNMILHNLNALKAQVPPLQQTSQTLMSQYALFNSNPNKQPTQMPTDQEIGSKFHQLQIFNSFMSNMNKTKKLETRDIPQIQFDSGFKVLNEIQKFAYFQSKNKPQQFRGNNEGNIGEKLSKKPTHTNVQTENMPELKESNNNSYRQYLQKHKEGVQSTRKSLSKMNSSGRKDQQRIISNKNSTYKRVEDPPSNRTAHNKRIEENRMNLANR